MKASATLLLFLLLLGACSEPSAEIVEYDVCVYGGSSAGVIAAYSAHQLGKTVLLVEPGNRLGGLSTGGLGQTDIGNKYAVNGLALDFYRRIGREYGELEKWTFEPKVALKVYHDYLEGTDVKVVYGHRLNRVLKQKKAISAVCLEQSQDPEGEKIFVRAKQYIDCSYEGDLMARSGVNYTLGRESNEKYGENYNGVQLRDLHQFPDGIDPYVTPGDPSSGLVWGISDKALLPDGSQDLSIQAYNFRVCLTNNPENMIPISRPENYDSTMYELFIRLIEKTGSTSIFNHFLWNWMPNNKTDINNNGGFSTDMIGMNHAYPEASYAKREEIIKAHKDYTLGFFYFLATDPRLPENMRQEMKKWGLPKDEFEESGHFTPQLYVREARRMIGEYVMTEANCTGDKVVDDVIGWAAYTMDSHNCQRLVVDGMVKNEGDVQVGGFPPYPIAYRSITPKREECTNLLVPVDLSASHIAYGSIRMEPVFMVLGQAAAVAASLAIDSASAVQKVDIEQLVELLRIDPLLDGSRPELVFDSEDPGVLIAGNGLERMDKAWRDKCYKMTYEYAAPGQGERNASLKFSVPVSGSYEVYYYCTSVNHLAGETGPIELLPASISSGGSQQAFSIPYKAHNAAWAACGNFTFEEGKEIIFSVDGSGQTGAFAVDAVLLIPGK